MSTSRQHMITNNPPSFATESAIRRITLEPMAEQCARADARVKDALLRLQDSADTVITTGLALVREVRKTKSGEMALVRADAAARRGARDRDVTLGLPTRRRSDDFDGGPGEDTRQFDALRSRG